MNAKVPKVWLRFQGFKESFVGQAWREGFIF